MTLHERSCVSDTPIPLNRAHGHGSGTGHHRYDFAVIEELAGVPGVRAIGETGLDCYWDDTPMEMQHDFFDRHLQLCRDTALPMVIHMRESGALIAEQLRRQTSVPPGVMHSFTGDLQLAWQCLEMGLHISFAGMVTFKKSQDLREVAKSIPEGRLLVETDSPYLSPEPFRGKRPNEPAVLSIHCDASPKPAESQQSIWHKSPLKTRNVFFNYLDGNTVSADQAEWSRPVNRVANRELYSTR